VAEWVSAAVKTLDKTLIKRSFEENGISEENEDPPHHRRLKALLESGQAPDVSEDSNSEGNSELESQNDSDSESESEIEVDLEKSARCKKLFDESVSEEEFEGFKRL
jgi:hypothetical protein